MAQLLHIGRLVPPARYTRWHQHPNWEIVVYTSGKGTLRVGRKRGTFQPGTVACLPPNIPHADDTQEDYGNFHLLCADLTPLEPVFHLFQDEPGHPCTGLVEMIHQEFYRYGSEKSREIVTHLFDAFMGYLEVYSRGREQQESRSNYWRQLEKILLQNLHNPQFEMGTAMQSFRVSPAHLRRLFKKATGKSPNHYLRDLRIEHAGRMLTAGFSVKEAAFNSGFSDPYYFSRCFRNCMGDSPRNFSRFVQNHSRKKEAAAN